MSRTFIPFSYTAADFATGGKWNPNAANFPGIKHFWKMTEASGTTITDAIGGMVLGAPAFTTDGTFLFQTVTTATSITTGITFATPPAGGGIVAMLCRYMDSVGESMVTLGTNTDAPVGADLAVQLQTMRANLGKSLLYRNGTTNYTSGTPAVVSTDKTQVICSRIMPDSTTGVQWCYHGDAGTAGSYVTDATVTKDAAPGASTGSGNLSLSSKAFIRVHGMAFLYVGMFSASQMPTIDECAQACAWHFENLYNGKNIYPGFAGKV